MLKNFNILLQNFSQYIRIYTYPILLRKEYFLNKIKFELGTLLNSNPIFDIKNKCSIFQTIKFTVLVILNINLKNLVLFQIQYFPNIYLIELKIAFEDNRNINYLNEDF